MCGIAGFWDLKAEYNKGDGHHIVQTMTDTLSHRGPDGADYTYDAKKGIGFGHRRLSIIDLSDAGRQPMVSANKRWVMTYNGEIYNAVEMRADLEQVGKTQFRGHSDTEILIEYIDSFGIEKTLSVVNGMFAFVIYDHQDDVIYTGRDHAGIKPLYWTCQSGVFAFGSELKPLIAHDRIDASLNDKCLADYFAFNTIPAPQTIFKNIYQLKPSHYMRVSRDGGVKTQRYWSLPKSDPAYDCDFEELLSDAVKRQMVSDVPLGVFLSGGIDSSLTTALMQKHSTQPVRSFTIGFEEATHDESEYASAVAKHLGTDHTQEILSVSAAKTLIETLPQYYDQPFADSSQLPSLLLCQMARKHVTVCLSGDGGDELFAGYSRYFYGQRAFRLADMVGAIPFADTALSCLSTDVIARLPGMPDNAQTKLQKIARMAGQNNPYARYRTLIDLWTDNPCQNRGVFDYQKSESDDVMDVMRRADMQCYLPDDILHKMDRASMAHSLEVRVPYLDPRVMDAAFRLPSSKHVRGKTGKIILRDMLAQYVPDELINRPKSGFSVPIAAWLRGDLKSMMDDAIDTLDDAFINKDIIQNRWQQHVKGTHNWQHSLWGVLMLSLWRNHYKI